MEYNRHSSSLTLTLYITYMFMFLCVQLILSILCHTQISSAWIRSSSSWCPELTQQRSKLGSIYAIVLCYLRHLTLTLYITYMFMFLCVQLILSILCHTQISSAWIRSSSSWCPELTQQRSKLGSIYAIVLCYLRHLTLTLYITYMFMFLCVQLILSILCHTQISSAWIRSSSSWCPELTQQRSKLGSIYAIVLCYLRHCLF